MAKFTAQIVQGKLQQRYIIGKNIISVDDIVYGEMALKCGYPYRASVYINGKKCGDLINNADGAASTIYCVPDNKDARNVLYAIMKQIRDCDKKNKNMERVCERLIENHIV